MYLELFSHLLIRKQPLGTWLLLINASRDDSHLLIRKRPLAIRLQLNNVFRVVFTLVEKNNLLGPGSYYSMHLELIHTC